MAVDWIYQVQLMNQQASQENRNILLNIHIPKFFNRNLKSCLKTTHHSLRPSLSISF